MGSTLATLCTITTYGTWLRGDARGWVQDGLVFPVDPTLHFADQRRMKHPAFLFDDESLLEVADILVRALVENLGLAVYAMTVQRWHSHFIVGPTGRDIGSVIKWAKAAPRWKLRRDRPLWADGYDQRWRFDARSVQTRIEYVERHNLRHGWDRRPSTLISDPG